MNKVMERLTKFGEDTLTTEELVAIIIGNETKTAKLLGTQNMFSQDEIIDTLKIVSKPYDDLKYLGQLTAQEASRLAAAVTLGKRLATVGNSNDNRCHVASPRDAAQYLAPKLASETHEIFVVMLLDTKNKIMRTVRVSEGSLTCAVVHPREVYAQAILHHAAAIIVAHNHPSGDPRPSDEDRELTRALVRTGEIMGVPIVDHVVIGRNADGWRYYSFKEHREL